MGEIYTPGDNSQGTNWVTWDGNRDGAGVWTEPTTLPSPAAPLFAVAYAVRAILGPEPCDPGNLDKCDMAIIAIPATLFIAFNTQLIIDLMYTNNPLYSGSILQILIFSFTAYCFMHIFSSLLTTAGKLRLLNIVFATEILMNFIANLILIPKMGALDAAVTTTFSEWIILVAIVVIALRFISTKTPS